MLYLLPIIQNVPGIYAHRSGYEELGFEKNLVGALGGFSSSDSKDVKEMLGKKGKIKSNNFNEETLQTIKSSSILGSNYHEIASIIGVHPKTLHRRRVLEPKLDLLIAKRRTMNAILHRMNIMLACQSGKNPRISWGILKHERKKRYVLEQTVCPHCGLRHIDEENVKKVRYIKRLSDNYEIEQKAMHELLNPNPEALAFINNRREEKKKNSNRLIKEKRPTTQNRLAKYSI